jgi:FKBP-type peptidyl-prolyl cis-trans isomerase FkpA
MNKASLALIIAASLALSACGSDKQTKEQSVDVATFTTDAQKHSYALGARMGKFADDQMTVQEELAIASDKAALMAGFKDAFNGESQYTEEEVEQFVLAFSTKFRAAEEAAGKAASAQAIEAGVSFLAENALREEVVTTESGLQYEVLTPADGAKPTAEDTVRVHYHGTLLDGTVFDSSVERDEPAEFPLNRVIPGWTEGVQLMEVGSKYRFYIPSQLAYGPRATGKIPANSALIFDVELLAIAPFSD